MRILLPLIATFGFAGIAYADEIQQTTMPNGSTVTTIATPQSTTQIVNNPGHSVLTQTKDGKKVEIDSDGSVYMVYPDGARVTAPDGITTLYDGQTVAVKDGKRIP